MTTYIDNRIPTDNYKRTIAFVVRGFSPTALLLLTALFVGNSCYMKRRPT